MRTDKRIDALTFSPRFLLLGPALLLTIVAASSHAGSSAVRDADDSRISVAAVAGDVDFTMAGNTVDASPNDTVLLPARIVTGHDGNVGLTQAGTNVSVANDSDVEIPAEAVDGNLIARMVQHRGNVFYDVAPRDLGKLRVETPFLVAVIKGTQFNVAVDERGTTISLFEGSLEIRTPDDSDVIQLNAGEIAIRSLIDDAIRVVGMNDDRAAAPRGAGPAAAAAAETAAAQPRAEPSDTGVDNPVAVASDAVAPSTSTGARDTSVAVKPVIDVAGAEIAARAPATLGVELDGSAVTALVDVKIDDVRSAKVDVNLDTRVDLGGAVDVALDTGVDLGTVDVDVDTRLDLGGAVVDPVLDVAVDTGLDLKGSLDGADTRVDLGGVLDTSLDAGVKLDADTLDLGLDTRLDLGGTLDLDLGLDVDLSGGTLDLGLADDSGTEPAPAPAPPPPPGGLLRGLLGLP